VVSCHDDQKFMSLAETGNPYRMIMPKMNQSIAAHEKGWAQCPCKMGPSMPIPIPFPIPIPVSGLWGMGVVCAMRIIKPAAQRSTQTILTQWNDFDEKLKSISITSKVFWHHTKIVACAVEKGKCRASENFKWVCCVADVKVPTLMSGSHLFRC